LAKSGDEREQSDDSSGGERRDRRVSARDRGEDRDSGEDEE
jgi:hypothetical protein